MSKKFKIVVTLEVDQDPSLLSDAQVEALHMEFWACGAEMYDISSSVMEFDGVRVASLGKDYGMSLMVRGEVRGTTTSICIYVSDVPGEKKFEVRREVPLNADEILLTTSNYSEARACYDEALEKVRFDLYGPLKDEV